MYMLCVKQETEVRRKKHTRNVCLKLGNSSCCSTIFYVNGMVDLGMGEKQQQLLLKEKRALQIAIHHMF